MGPQDRTCFSSLDMASLHVILNEKRISHVFISLNAAPTKVWACAILQRLPTAGYLRMPRKSKGFILLPRQSIFSALSQAEGWCWAGMRVKRLPVGLAPANDQRRTGANRFLSLRPQFPPLKNGWCVCWGSLLEGLLSLPPVLTCWNSLCFPLPSQTPPLQPLPALLLPLPRHVYLSCQSDQISPEQALEKKHLCIPGRRQSSNALIAKAALLWGEKKGSQNLCFYYGVQKGGAFALGAKGGYT